LCTVIVSVEPEADVPVLLVGVRDEFVTRPWMSPDRFWPDHPGLIGGKDLQAGGTWLAADPEARRVGVLLNGEGRLAPQEARLTRGDLPLQAAQAGELPPVDLVRYDPFHLLVAGLDGVRLWSWDGESLAEDKLPQGVHMLVNSGWDREAEHPRVAWFLPAFAAAARPPWQEGGSTQRFWGDWLTLASSGAGPAAEDPRALIMRRRLEDGRVFASLSVSLVALSERGMRFDFCPTPDDPTCWHRVSTGSPGERRGRLHLN
jgi:hypothetical protein